MQRVRTWTMASAGALLVASACGDSPPAHRRSLVASDDAGAPADSAAADASASDASAALEDAGPSEDAAMAACGFAPRSLRWPLDGARGKAWEVTDYVDLDARAGLTRDFTGAHDAQAKTYDGHNGTDISLASFRDMDRGVALLAVEAGTVTSVVDGFADRNTDRLTPGCSDVQNAVVVVAPGGRRVEYQHIQRGSARVKVGDLVKAGDVLALVGSSGCSGGPHLHLSVVDCQGVVVDPFAADLFVSPPAYDASPSALDSVLSASGIHTLADIQDASPDARSRQVGEFLGVAAMVAAGHTGEALTLRVLRADGSVARSLTTMLSTAPRLSYLSWNVRIDGPDGTSTLELTSGASTLFARSLTVTHAPVPKQRILLAISPDSLESTLADQAKAGFYPRVLDGYALTSATCALNLVLDAGTERRTAAELSAAQFADTRSAMAALGYVPVSVDAYGPAAQIRYAAVFEKTEDTRSYVELPFAMHADEFKANAKDGFVLVSQAIAVLSADEAPHVAAVYARAADLSQQARTGVSASSYDTYDDAQSTAGLSQLSLAVSDFGAGELRSGVWTSFHPGGLERAFDLTEAELMTQSDAQSARGLLLRDLSAYMTPGGLRYAALWVAAALK